MCKVYYQIGSLTTIKNHLQANSIYEFNSLNDIIVFQKNYNNLQQQITSRHISIIEEEKSRLETEIAELEQLIKTTKSDAIQKLDLELEQLKKQFENLHSTNSNIFIKIVNNVKSIVLKRKIKYLENHFDDIITQSVIYSTGSFNTKSNRFNFISSQFSEAVQQSGLSELRELERKKTIIDQITPSIYGAIGENKVSKELERLSDDYILINDFNCSFHPALYNRKENDYIKSVQIDHILISPAGIFLIETKNWSEQSLNNLILRSPVEQIKRTNFALFKILNEELTRSLNRHHWGDRKISIRNLIVLINQKPIEEFQFVKILTLNELKNYVEYFKPIFSKNETELMANYLLRINGSKN